MLTPRKLRVKPVRKYRVPRYPSHTDPDPTLHPQPVPYPAGRKLLAAIAAAGLLTTTSCSGPETPASIAPPPPPEEESITVAEPHKTEVNDDDPENLENLESLVGRLAAIYDKEAEALSAPLKGNQFPVALSGLPHTPSSYGTGVPNYINAELARRAVERIFRQAGYRLATKKQYDRDGVAFVMDGYDADKKMGFVVADYDNLDTDAMLHWFALLREDGKSSVGEEIEALLQVAKLNESLKTVVADIESAKRLPDTARRETAYRAILAKRRKGLLSLAEVKQMESRALQKKEYVAVISRFDKRFAESDWGGANSDEVFAILEIKDSAKQDEAWEKWFKAQEKEATLKSVARLENAVREYIAWARSQGAQ